LSSFLKALLFYDLQRCGWSFASSSRVSVEESSEEEEEEEEKEEEEEEEKEVVSPGSGSSVDWSVLSGKTA
jgi:hypothetical protein